jgi:hypothetical protein
MGIPFAGKNGGGKTPHLLRVWRFLIALIPVQGPAKWLAWMLHDSP